MMMLQLRVKSVGVVVQLAKALAKASEPKVQAASLS
jgi:hypothetical protein